MAQLTTVNSACYSSTTVNSACMCRIVTASELYTSWDPVWNIIPQCICIVYQVYLKDVVHMV